MGTIKTKDGAEVSVFVNDGTVLLYTSDCNGSTDAKLTCDERAELIRMLQEVKFE